MATLRIKVLRLIMFGFLVTALGAVPAIVSVAGPNTVTDVPMASCAPGEQQDPVTLICGPGSAPNGVGVAPGLNEQWQEQDIYGTPGEQPGQAGGTTVP
jgi:hypothetical protein